MTHPTLIANVPGKMKDVQVPYELLPAQGVG
jgi:hypothetical protein